MDVKTKNALLADGQIDREDMWPRIYEMESKATQFRFEFGLIELPTKPGLITIRGPRQYGKSTWLEMNLRESIQDFGKGSAYYLNGDEIASTEELDREMTALYPAYSPQAGVKRLFIDEITAIDSWEKALKRVLDRGLYRDALIVTTGSKATDLRRGLERMPGRKGKLPRSDYIFLPISYREFKYMTRNALGDKTWIAYLLSGGSPIACNEIYQFERIPDYFTQIVRDWIYGEILATGRRRMAIAQLMHTLFTFGGTPVGYAKLARESGLANNTIASGYIEQLGDLFSVLPAWPIETGRGILQFRKPCKFHFVNLAVAANFHPAQPRYVHEYESLPGHEQGVFLEWLVAQEIWRRSVLRGSDAPESLGFWASKEHEIDFITPEGDPIEVKRGRAGPLDFQWFSKTFPKKKLTVICSSPFDSQCVQGLTIDDFLMNAPTDLEYHEDEEVSVLKNRKPRLFPR